MAASGSLSKSPSALTEEAEIERLQKSLQTIAESLETFEGIVGVVQPVVDNDARMKRRYIEERHRADRLPSDVGRLRSHTMAHFTASKTQGNQEHVGSLPQSYKPNFINVLKVRNFLAEMKSLETLCGCMHRLAIRALHVGY